MPTRTPATPSLSPSVTAASQQCLLLSLTPPLKWIWLQLKLFVGESFTAERLRRHSRQHTSLPHYSTPPHHTTPHHTTPHHTLPPTPTPRPMPDQGGPGRQAGRQAGERLTHSLSMACSCSAIDWRSFNHSRAAEGPHFYNKFARNNF